jgi:hypothetical protein
MSTLKQQLNFMDCILNKKDQKKMYMVLKETVHNMWVIDMEGKEEPFEIPKRMINMVYMKVDPKTVKVLFSERVDENINNDPQFEPTESQTDDSTSG